MSDTLAADANHKTPLVDPEIIHRFEEERALKALKFDPVTVDILEINVFAVRLLPFKAFKSTKCLIIVFRICLRLFLNSRYILQSLRLGLKRYSLSNPYDFILLIAGTEVSANASMRLSKAARSSSVNVRNSNPLQGWAHLTRMDLIA